MSYSLFDHVEIREQNTCSLFQTFKGAWVYLWSPRDFFPDLFDSLRSWFRMSSRVTRRVMRMTDDELSAVLAVAMPKTNFDGISREQRQESVLKWWENVWYLYPNIRLFAHGLSMNHEFMLDIEDDDIYVLMRNKPCTCCPKSIVFCLQQAIYSSPRTSSLVPKRGRCGFSPAIHRKGKISRRTTNCSERPHSSQIRDLCWICKFLRCKDNLFRTRQTRLWPKDGGRKFSRLPPNRSQWFLRIRQRNSSPIRRRVVGKPVGESMEHAASGWPATASCLFEQTFGKWRAEQSYLFKHVYVI